jgi:hypothetical protein
MMRRGLLSAYFEGIAVKRLSAVEVDTSRSNQHEFNGVNTLKKILGPDRARFPARFVWLGDEQEALSEDGFLTWYDAREHHPTRSEYRLYFPSTSVSGLANEGDALFIAKRTDGSVMVIITPAASTIQNQLLWLFAIPDQPALSFEAQEVPNDTTGQLDFAVRYVLDELGIEAEEPETDILDPLIERFGLRFPTTREFSQLARDSLPGIVPADNPDVALLAWMEREELLFRRLERHVVGDRLRAGFASGSEADVDGFLNFSLSVQNRRKARAGAALEHHLEAVFKSCALKFDRGVETENRNKPDFLFPGAAEYRDPVFPSARLTMLGAKSTLKDRWRQVLAEAERIQKKHLLTLEPGVSENQTDQMRVNQLQLVVPTGLQETYRPAQRDWLLSVADFIAVVRDRQNDGRP